MLIMIQSPFLLPITFKFVNACISFWDSDLFGIWFHWKCQLGQWRDLVLAWYSSVLDRWGRFFKGILVLSLLSISCLTLPPSKATVVFLSTMVSFIISAAASPKIIISLYIVSKTDNNQGLMNGLKWALAIESPPLGDTLLSGLRRLANKGVLAL